MRRFWRLVKNEYIKNFRLISVRIMMILVIVAAIGIPVLFKVVDYINSQYSYDSFYGETIKEQLEYYTEGIDIDHLSDYDKEYINVLKFLIDCGAESLYDWRCLAMSEVFDNAWNLAVNTAYDDEIAEYMANAAAEVDGYTIEDGEAMLDEKISKAFSLVTSSKEYTTAKNAIANNDMNAWYNFLIDKTNSEKPSDISDPEYDMLSELHELDLWLYTYLRDNQVYYGQMNADIYWAKFAAGDLFDQRFYDAYNTYELKKTIIYYNYGQESASSYKRAVNELALEDYIAENNITYNVADYAGGSIEEIDDIDMWSVFYLTSYAITFVGLLVIVIAAMSVSSEFSNGTIKFLLINPVKRWKILVSKYFTVISTGYIMIAVMFVLSLITSMIAFGGSLITADYITAQNGEVIVTSGLLFMLRTYLLSSVQVVVMSTIAFAISVLMKSSAFAIGISMLGMLAGNTLVLILSQFHQDWARYLIFANLNLASISRGQSTFMYQTVGSASAVIAVHMVLLWLIAWDGFTRREV